MLRAVLLQIRLCQSLSDALFFFLLNTGRRLFHLPLGPQLSADTVF